ncbi:MAG TPA: hypothetical protein VGN37_22130 [Actinocatenispora sp.]
MTTYAAPAVNAPATGITLVGEIVNLDVTTDSPDTSTLSVRWLGVTLQPGRTADEPVATDAGSAPGRPPLPGGLRGLTEGIRRLIDGPPGRHRAHR